MSRLAARPVDRSSALRPDYDLLIAGGGINGVAIARDAAGRGLSVLLAEQDDLAAHTSSASSKLIHGGLRYLEYYEFRLVREALMERERLLAIAPHIIWPLEFVLPYHPRMRPVWMLRAGLFLYDHLAHRSRLPASRFIHLARHPAGAALKPAFGKGFTYADCRVDDSRLVVLTAQDAAARGARIRTRTRLLGARPRGALWQAELEDVPSGRRETVTVRVLVNATGPWVGEVLARRLGKAGGPTVRKVKGSHIVVPRLYAGEHAYTLENPDRRIVFMIPYEGEFTLIGTTDVPYSDDPAQVTASPEEIAYLCDSVNRYLRQPLTPAQVIHHYAGVRPLYDDHKENASAVTRDYVLRLDGSVDEAIVLSVFGGKITTHRRLAEHALEKLLPLLGRPDAGAWTATMPLPGGDLNGLTPAAYAAELKARHPALPGALLDRYARSYGSLSERVLGGARGLADLGMDFGAGLCEREVEYLVREEWAMTAEDILWRRSKIGLHCPPETRDRLAAYLGASNTLGSSPERNS